MKVLIRATNWVGDAIMALPALRAVRSHFPDAEIAILARPYVADIYRDQQICDQLIPYDPRGDQAGFSGRERLAGELRTHKFDLALLLQNAFDAAWLAWRAGIPQRIGYARDGRSLLLDQGRAGSDVRRNPHARAVLLPRTDSPSRMARSIGRREVHFAEARPWAKRAGRKSSSRRRLAPERVACRRRRRRLLRFGKVLAAGEICRRSQSPGHAI